MAFDIPRETELKSQPASEMIRISLELFFSNFVAIVHLYSSPFSEQLQHMMRVHAKAQKMHQLISQKIHKTAQKNNSINTFKRGIYVTHMTCAPLFNSSSVIHYYVHLGVTSWWGKVVRGN